MKRRSLITALVVSLPLAAARAQVAPSASEAAAYSGLHAAAQQGDAAKIARLVAGGAAVNATDARGRTPLHVATFARQRDAIAALVKVVGDTGRKPPDAEMRAASPSSHVPAVEAELYDGSGQVRLVWLGRRQILGITPRTVTFHLNNVVIKLGASSKCQAISWALKQGVVRLNVELASVANVDEQQ
mgnify:CR=1 FL=1